MTCFKCGAHNPDDAVYCNKCGSKIEPYKTSYQHSQKQMDSTNRSVIIGIVTALILLGALVLFFVASVDKSADPKEQKSATEFK